MPVSADTLRTHLDYTAWASRKLVAAAEQLSGEQITRDFGTSDKSVLGTLVHTFAADRIWLGRIRGNVPARFVDVEKDMHLSILQNDWPAVHQGWSDWAKTLDDSQVAAKTAYRDLKGNPYETPLWQIVLHVVNHGTHHRGQASGFLRTMGIAPPQLDLIYYYRELR